MVRPITAIPQSLVPTSVLVRVSIAVKRHHDIQLRWATYSFRGLVQYHHSKKHRSMQADMVLEKKMRVLHFDLQATDSELSNWAWLEHI